MAKRLGRKEWDVKLRVDELRAQKEEPPTMAEGFKTQVQFVKDKSVPRGVKIYGNVLAPMQQGVIEATAHYKALGDVLAGFNEHVGAQLAEPELAELLTLLLNKPRKKGEKLGEKLARLLLQEFMVIPNYIEPAAPIKPT